MLRKIHLYGNLAQTYGEEFSLNVSSIGETLIALDANFPGFLNDIRIGKFHVLKGELNEVFDFGENQASLLLRYEDDEPFHIMPAIEGAGGNNGWLNVILGVVLIAVSWWNPMGWGAAAAGVGGWGAGSAAWGAGMALGASLALTGIAQLMSPTPQISSKGYEREAEKPSFVFNGPVNRTEQGGPITLVYGEIITGSIVVGGSIDSEEYA